MSRTSSQAQHVEVRTIERPDYMEYHLTVAAAGGEVDAGAALADAAERLASDRVEIVQEKLYGHLEVRAAVLELRGQLWERSGVAGGGLTWVEGAPARAHARGFAGLQVWGVRARDGRRMVQPAEQGARTLEGPGFRLAYLPAVHGRTGGGEAEQAAGMFAGAAERLRSLGFSYGQVVRTWIYLARLLDWYGDLNRVRAAHHARLAPGGDLTGAVFPASTGIQGRDGEGACFMDVLALERTDAAVRSGPIRRSARQDAAFAYGSSFSRGMWLDVQGVRTVYVSGTASIDARGESVHVGAPEPQVFQTLLSLATLLHEQGLGLTDICSATVFCKDEPALDAWLSVTALLGLPRFPCVFVRADVCRPELLVEIEAVAAGGRREAALPETPGACP